MILVIFVDRHVPVVGRRAVGPGSPVSPAPTILVFDSGLGGLTVFREIVKARPHCSYVYVADDEFFPYGHHSEDAVVGRVVPLIGQLIERHRPAIVVIACNTASTLVLPHLRAAYAVPFVGTVPAIKPACNASRSRRVSVLGTRGTVKREYTQKLIHDFGAGCEVTLVGAAELPSMAEAALRGEIVTDDAIRAEVAPCFLDGKARTDTIVLACTHFPLLLDRLERVAPWPVDWIDPAPAIARRTAELLGPQSDAAAVPARFILTSGRSPSRTLAGALKPYFGDLQAA